MLDFNIINAIGIMAIIILLIVYGFPYLRKMNIGKDIYADIKKGLMVFGYAFRDEKVKAITDMIYGIVETVEKLDMAGKDKQLEAMQAAFTKLMEEFDIVLDEGAMLLIIDIAVSYLPATKKELE